MHADKSKTNSLPIINAGDLASYDGFVRAWSLTLNAKSKNHIDILTFPQDRSLLLPLVLDAHQLK